MCLTTNLKIQRVLVKNFLLIAMLVISSSPVAFAKVKTKPPQGSGCRYVCREEYKICRKGRKACLRQYRRCVRACPR